MRAGVVVIDLANCRRGFDAYLRVLHQKICLVIGGRFSMSEKSKVRRVHTIAKILGCVSATNTRPKNDYFVAPTWVTKGLYRVEDLPRPSGVVAWYDNDPCVSVVMAISAEDKASEWWECRVIIDDVIIHQCLGLLCE